MTEPSLYSPPIFRRFLAGGPQRLRLSLSGAAGVVGVGMMLWAISAAVSLFGGAESWTMPPGTAAAATLAALLLALLAARWLGSRLGALAGLIQLTSLHVLCGGGASAGEMLLAAAVTAAMGIFALTNVAGRLPSVDQRWPHWAFFAAAGVSFLLAGPVGPAFILAGCVMFLIINGDPRGGWFFVDPIGIVLFAGLVAIRYTAPEASAGDGVQPWLLSGHAPGPRTSLSDVLGSLAAGTAPWTPLVVLAVLVGLYKGHYATPLWRFFGCWVLGPLALAAVFGCPPPLSGLLPPLSVMGAVGFSGLLVWCRRRCRMPAPAMRAAAGRIPTSPAVLPPCDRSAADRWFPCLRQRFGAACHGGHRASSAVASRR